MTFQNFTPMEYMKIDIASNFGLGKAQWDDRIAWFDNNEAQLDSLVELADEPALFYAGVQAYKKLSAGEASGYPISLDATASGAQILACLIGCEKSAKLCNVLDTGDREDFYKNIYTEMCHRTGDTYKIAHPDVKQACMTSLYGSTAVPKQVFGEGELLQVFLETMDDMAPGIWQLNSAMVNLWQPDVFSHDWVMPDNFHVHVPVMDDEIDHVQFLNRPYAVHSKINRPVEKGLAIGAHIAHSTDGMIVREMGRRCDYDPEQVTNAKVICYDAIQNSHSGFSADRKSDNVLMVQMLMKRFDKSGYLSARIIEHIDIFSINYVTDLVALRDMLETLPAKPFKVMTIHDCFRVLPNYGNDLRMQYNHIMHDIAKSNLLECLASQIANTQVIAPKFGDITAGILEANYALS